MVNIITLNFVQPNGEALFQSPKSFWRVVLNVGTESEKAHYSRQLNRAEFCEKKVKQAFCVTDEQVAHVHFVFGSTKEALRQLQDPEIRDLIFDLDNKITVQVFTKPGARNLTVTTVYNGQTCEIFTFQAGRTTPLLQSTALMFQAVGRPQQ